MTLLSQLAIGREDEKGRYTSTFITPKRSYIRILQLKNEKYDPLPASHYITYSIACRQGTYLRWRDSTSEVLNGFVVKYGEQRQQHRQRDRIQILERVME